MKGRAPILCFGGSPPPGPPDDLDPPQPAPLPQAGLSPKGLAQIFKALNIAPGSDGAPCSLIACLLLPSIPWHPDGTQIWPTPWSVTNKKIYRNTMIALFVAQANICIWWETALTQRRHAAPTLSSSEPFPRQQMAQTAYFYLLLNVVCFIHLVPQMHCYKWSDSQLSVKNISSS